MSEEYTSTNEKQVRKDIESIILELVGYTKEELTTDFKTTLEDKISEIISLVFNGLIGEFLSHKDVLKKLKGIRAQ